MAEPKDMRFYCTGLAAVPVGPAESQTYRGRPRKAFTLAEAAEECGWPATALVALFNATYPPGPDEDDGWVDPFAEALYTPEVKDRLAFHAAALGRTPPAVFLVALLDDWDATDVEGKAGSLINAMGVEPSPADGFHKSVAGGGKGADHE